MDLDLFKGSQQADAGRTGQARRPTQPSEPVRNYFFIDNKELPQVDLSKYPAKDEQEYYGKLFVTITTLQDIFIGSGEIDKSGNQLYDVFSYINTGSRQKKWNLPGSSLKGCILSHLSIFLKAGTIDFFSAKVGPAKVFFSDLPINPGIEPTFKEIPARFSPRIDPNNAVLKLYKKEYKKDTPPQGGYNSDPGKEHIQVIKSGSCFQGYIHFKQLAKYEIVMLVLALGSLPGSTFNFKLGGAKNRAMGLVRLAIDFEKSFYAHSLKDIAVERIFPFAGFRSGLEAAYTRIKKDYPALEELLKKIQQEYGQ